MTSREIRAIIRAICAGRLAGWADRLVEEHATPAVLIGVGHGRVSGRLCLCVTEDGFTDAQIAALLRCVADELDQGRAERRHT